MLGELNLGKADGAGYHQLSRVWVIFVPVGIGHLAPLRAELLADLTPAGTDENDT